MEHLTFRKADRTDIESIYQMEARMVMQYEDPTVTDLHQALEWCRTKVEGNYEGYTCIYLHGEKAGYYHLIPQLDLRTELDDLLILPAYRRQGIAQAVMEKILKETDETIYLYIFTANQKAVLFYTDLGFQIMKRISPTRVMMEYRK